MSLRRGVRLALDWGQARIGVASCDPEGVLAYPVETIQAGNGEEHVTARLGALLEEYEPLEVILGLPKHLRGTEGETAAAVRQRGEWLSERWGVQVRLVDERLTTVSAAGALRSAGKSARSQREILDQAAAVAILDHALDIERNTGRPPGQLIDTGRKPDGP